MRISTSKFMLPALTGKRRRQGREELPESVSAAFSVSFSFGPALKPALVDAGSRVVDSDCRRWGACGLAQGSEVPGSDEGVAWSSGSGGRGIGEPSAASACGSDRLGIAGMGMGMGIATGFGFGVGIG